MYVKVFSDMLDSSLWAEDSDTRIVWLTILMLADEDGIVRATLPGISHRARVSMEATARALALFEGPDPNSRTPDHEGRRIMRTDGGYAVLNYALYRAITCAAQRKEQTRERVRAYRERNSADVTLGNAPVTLGNACNAIQKHKQTHKQTQEYTYEFASFWNKYPNRVDKALAAKKWESRISEGLDADMLIACATRYAEACEILKTEQNYIMRPATFLGPNRRWEDYTAENYKRPEPPKPDPKKDIIVYQNLKIGPDNPGPSGRYTPPPPQ